MSPWVSGALWGFGASVAASAVFLLALSTLRPRLKIAPRIAKTDTGKYGADAVRYRIKFVNRSWRSCVDVAVNVYVVKVAHVPSSKAGQTGSVRSLAQVDAPKHLTYIAGRRTWDKNDKHAQRVRIDQSVIEDWEKTDDTYILVRVFARDGFSGFSKVFEQEFKLAGNVEDGTFESGNSLCVVPYKPRSRTPAARPKPAKSKRSGQGFNTYNQVVRSRRTAAYVETMPHPQNVIDVDVTIQDDETPPTSK